MDFVNYVAYIVIMLCFGLLYARFKRRIEQDDEIIELQLINEYLMNSNNDIDNKKKPIIWIHSPTERNSRKWSSFGSRTSVQMNQPYTDLAIQTIVSHCGDSFKICLIDDNSFTKLIPDWDVSLAVSPDPIKSRLRNIGFAKLLHKYGGMFVPISFVCTSNLSEMYHEMITDVDLFVSEVPSHTINGTGMSHESDEVFIGGKRGAQIIEEYETYISYMVSADVSASSDFLGTINRWLSTQIGNGVVGLIPGQTIGTRDANGSEIIVDDLMSETFIHLHCTSCGILIPEKQLRMRTKFNWFCVLTPYELMQSNVFAAKMLSIGLESINI